MPINCGLVGEFHGAVEVADIGNILTTAGLDRERRIALHAIREVNVIPPPRERQVPLPGLSL